jgi:hypothetical protein
MSNKKVSERRSSLGAWAGVVGPLVFVAVFTLEGWYRPGYDPVRMFVSALSMGPRGWIQITSFIVTGASFLLFARSVAVRFPTGPASRAGPIMLTIIGACLIGSGPFVMDSPEILFPQMSFHGRVHSILGAFVFSLGPASCFVFFRRFRLDADWRPLRWWTLAAGIVMTTAVVLMKVAMLPPPAPPSPLHAYLGVIQRVAIVSLMGWIASVAGFMIRRK